VSVVPLLDSPSAVGDEGRPRATSLAVVSAVLAALVTAVGFRVGQPDLLLSLGPFAGLAAAGLALLDRRRFVHQFFGHALLTWFGLPLASLVVLSPLLGPVPVTVAGLAVALFGLAATWSDTGDRKSLRRGLYATGRVTIATWLWLVVGLLVGSVAVFLVVVPTSGTPGPSSAVIVFCGVLVVAAVGALVGLRWLPLRQLAARPRRPRVAATARRLQLATGAVAAVALLVGVTTVVAPADGWVPDAATVLASRVTVGAVVGLAGATFLAGALARGARTVANRGDPTTRDRLAAALAGLPLGAVALVVLPVAGPFGLAVVAAVLGAQFLLLVLLSVTYVAADLEMVPDRTGAPAMVAAGLFVAAVAATRVSPLLAVVCVAAACLAWDLSTFGLGVTAELGHRPRTRRLVLVHGVVSVAVGTVAVLAVLALEALRPFVAGNALPAFVVAGGVFLVVATLRG
jgi:hypothetical protein